MMKWGKMKMNNKVLVKVYVPTLDSSYDVFIPVNELVWKANKLIVKSISDYCIPGIWNAPGLET